jgi:hypothetical protein
MSLGEKFKAWHQFLSNLRKIQFKYFNDHYINPWNDRVASVRRCSAGKDLEVAASSEPVATFQAEHIFRLLLHCQDIIFLLTKITQARNKLELTIQVVWQGNQGGGGYQNFGLSYGAVSIGDNLYTGETTTKLSGG